LEFVGKLEMGNEAKQVEWNVSELLVAGVKNVIFDLSMVDGIDSTGVGIIVMCQAKLQKAGGVCGWAELRESCRIRCA